MTATATTDKPAAKRTRAPQPPDTIIGHREIEALFGASHRTSNQWQGRGILPAPDFRVNDTGKWYLPCWWLSTIEAWADDTGRTIDPDARARVIAQAGTINRPAAKVGADRTLAKWED